MAAGLDEAGQCRSGGLGEYKDMRAFMSGCRWAVAVSVSIGLGAVLVPFVAITPAHADATFEFRGNAATSAGRSKRAASKQTSGGERASRRQTRQRFSHNGAQSKRMSLGATEPRQTRESLTGGSKRISRSVASRKLRASTRGYRRSGVRTASLGDSYVPRPEVGRSLTGGGVKWVANSGCLNSSLRAVIHQVASAFGPVTVNSTCRGRRHNARVGGARHSHHLSGNAVDFRVGGASSRAVYSFLRSHGSVGGLKLYRRGFFHIDTGSRRTW